MIKEAFNSDYNDILQLGDDVNKNNLDFNNPFAINKIYKEENVIIGYINYSIMYEKAELNYIYVHLDYRKNKVASKLLENMINDCLTKKVDEITLEVRISNENAINLYKKHKFKIVGLRKKYYHDGEDAYLMSRTLVIE